MGFFSSLAAGFDAAQNTKPSVKGSGYFDREEVPKSVIPSAKLEEGTLMGRPIYANGTQPVDNGLSGININSGRLYKPSDTTSDQDVQYKGSLPSSIPPMNFMGDVPQEQNPLQQQFPMAYKVAQALGSIESSGNYSALGPTVHGANAIGKYQIMPSNIPSWGKEATGQEVTPAQFKSDHALQDRIAIYKVNALLQQGYTPQDVASIWLSGRPMTGNQRKDLATGISVPKYVASFNRAFGTVA